MSLSFPSIWVPGSSFILASCLIGKEAISSILLNQCVHVSHSIQSIQVSLVKSQPITTKYFA